MVKKLQTPLKEEDIKNLEAGDFVKISGEIVTGRDRAHEYLAKEKQELPFSLEGSVLYHMGPIVKKENKSWKIVSAGPTTSIREEMYQYDVIKNYGVKAIIGKGGMAEKTQKALEEFNAGYLCAIGGTAASLSKNIVEVLGVHKLEEFGSPEAMWHLKIKDFPAIVTMDSKGNNLHNLVSKRSFERLKRLL